MENEAQKTTDEWRISSRYREKYRNITPPESSQKAVKETVNGSSFGYCFLFVLGAMTNQGTYINLKSLSIRTITLVILFFGLLMCNAYSSVLISRLAVGRTGSLFPTLESIAEAKTHKLCVRMYSYAFLLFKEHEKDEYVMPMWRGVVNEDPCVNTSTPKDIANVICADGTVVLEAPNIVASIIEEKRTPQPCTITKMIGHYARATACVLLKKNFRYKHLFDRILFRLQDAGIMDYMHRKWLSRRIPGSLDTRFSGEVNMNHIAGVIFVYLGAICTSLLILCSEILIHNYNSEKYFERHSFYHNHRVMH